MSEHVPGPAETIAVIGLAGRFPGARDVDAFWRNVRDGVDSITVFSAEELRRNGVPDTWLADPRYVRANGVLDDIELFDAEFFDVTPREAEITDPQHRILLECAWESLENAGYDPECFAGRIGVYAGAGISTYLLRNILSRGSAPAGTSELQLLMGNNKDYVPTRISYKLNLKGPSINVNTACSTSLVAVHLACQALLDFQCDIALAGGVGIQVPQRQGYWYEEGGIGSPDGRCRAFDAKAAGTVSGNGAGLVVLKRFADAWRDGDCIRAVIRGSAVNNDGRTKAGYTAPSVDGQAEVIAEALALAGVEPHQVGYLEAHGTGTAVGDPIELTALTHAFASARDRRQFCAIGSVKTNIGHLDEAAGVAGLIKTVCAIEHGLIPPSLHFEQPTANFDLAASPFFVNTRLTPWTDSPRRAGVSSFGIGGTNAHVVLEEAPHRPPSDTTRTWHLLPLSAKTPAALEAATSNLAARLAHANDAATLADVAYTLSVGRRPFAHRRVLVSDSLRAAATALDTRDVQAIPTSVVTDQHRQVVFLFPGQGAQYARMAQRVYRQEPSFRERVDQCAEILRDAFGYDFRDWLYPSTGTDDDHAATQLRRTAYAQPILFSLEYALAQLLMTWGVQPHVMIGHSLGEYVAACVAGVFSLEDGLMLVARRGALMDALSGGAMLAVRLPEAELRSMLPRDVSVAACNGPSLTTLSGSADAVRALQERLVEGGIGCQLLATSHGFHSRLMEPILPGLHEIFRKVSLRPPDIPYFSNVTGRLVSRAEATDPLYWVTHTRQTVQFGPALANVFAGAMPILLEVGPGRNLASAATHHSGRPAAQPVYTTLPHPDDPEPDDRVLFTTLGKLWLHGVRLDWAAIYGHERPYRVPLPSYPFERQRYWIDNSAPLQMPAEKKADIASWFYLPSWQRSALSETTTHRTPPNVKRWLLFVDDLGLGVGLAERLVLAGADVATVSAGNGFRRVGPNAFTLDPRDSDHYVSLIKELAPAHDTRLHIVHLWSLDADRDVASWHSAQDRGFHSLMFLTQAIRSVGTDSDVRIDVVSSGLHDVVGSERLMPAVATTLGFVRVIPQECANISCRSIDFDSSRQLDHLLAELTADAQDPLIAWRGPYRWTQRFQPIRLDEIMPATSRLKRGGTYLITGGLGGVGTILAEYLAREYKANLALVGRTDLASRARAICEATERASSNRGARLIAECDGFAPAANALCAAYIYEYFGGALEPGLRRGQRWSRHQLQEALRILPRFSRFVDFFLRVLADGGLIRAIDDGVVEVVMEPAQVPKAAFVREALLQQFPGFAGVVSLLDHCVRHYRTALTGETEPIAVLYPDGTSALLEQAAANTTVGSYRDVYINALQELIAEACGTRTTGRVRILEVGVGDGILARAVAPHLPPDRVEYWATDISRTFVVRAEKDAAAAGLNFMRFGILDIAQGPMPPEIESGGFDFILGLDVVHATPRIAETLERLQGLLAPGGVLALVESVGAHRWIDMIWGLADGWWSFEDEELRTDSPLLPLSRWEDVLGRAGFARVQAFPGDQSSRRLADYGLILAQRPLHQVQRLVHLGADVLVLTADVGDEAQMTDAMAHVRHRFGRVDGVIHAAGVTHGDVVFRPIDDASREQAETLFRSKIQGPLVLSRLLADEPIDFCLLISSNAAILGGLGFGAYAASNVFMDAFATAHSRRTGQRWISANWDGWPTEEIAGTAVTFQTSIDRFAMTRSESERAFERVLAQSSPHVIVSSADLDGRREVWTTRVARSKHDVSPREAAVPVGSSLHLRPHLSTEYAPPDTPTERALCRIWQELFAIDRIGVDDNFFELRGDSLLAIQLIATASTEFNVRVPIRSIFEHASVSKLARVIDDLGAAATLVSRVPAHVASAEEEEGAI